MPLAAGARLGSYEIVSAIGAGGMGEVCRVRDARLGRDVAIKVMPSHMAGDASSRQRFEREARTLATLSHPHICPVFDVGHQDGIDFLDMRVSTPAGIMEQYARSTNWGPRYDVFPDGRFVMLRGADPQGTREIVLVQNFFEEAKRLAPAR